MSTVNKTINIYAKKISVDKKKVSVSVELPSSKQVVADYPKVIYQGTIATPELPVEIQKEEIAVDVLPENSILGKSDDTFVHVNLEGYGEFSTTGEYGTANPKLFKYLETDSKLRDQLYLHTQKLFKDIVSKSDSRILDTLKSLKSTASTAEEFRVEVDFIRNFFESSKLQDSIIKGFFKRLEDSSTLSDIAKLSFVKILNDTLSSSETLKYDLEKSLSEAVDATDDFYGILNADDDQIASVEKFLKDNTSVSEVFNAVMHFYRYPEDTTLTQDSVIYTIDKILIDVISYVERLAFSLEKILRDSFISSDSAKISFNKVDQDLYTISENYRFDVELLKKDLTVTSVKMLFDTLKLLLDSTLVVDEVRFKTEFYRSFSSGMSTSDFTVTTVDKIISDVSTTAEYLRYDCEKVINDFVSTPEALIFETQKTISELIDATDDFYGILNADDDQVMLLNKDLKDIVTNNDFVGKIINLVLKDIVLTSDVFGYKTAGLEQTPEDQGTIQERTYNTIIKVLSEGYLMSDRPYLQLNKPLYDNSDILDGVTSIDVGLSKTEGIETVEGLDFSVDRVYDELSLISDIVLLALHKRFTEVLNSQDEKQVFLISKLLFEVIEPTEALYADIIKPKFDTVITHDSGFINVQDYFAEFYVEPGYVGTNYNF